MYEVLVIEDDERIAEIQSRFVDSVSGFKTIAVAGNAAEGRELCKILKPDLIILDISLPDGSGLELLKGFRQQALETDVIVVTATQETDVFQESLRGGVFDYLLKPMSYQRLQESLMNYQEFRAEVLNSNSLEQSKIDLMLAKNRRKSVRSKMLPKGIDESTLALVKKHFENPERNRFTAENFARFSGMSRTTARRYLEFLVSIDELESEHSYGTIGRPQRSYTAKSSSKSA